MFDACAICCESLPDDDGAPTEGDATLRWPTCGHRFHTLCALRAAQYDNRCPMCRSEHADLPARPRERPVVISTTVVTPAPPSSSSSSRSRLPPWLRSPASFAAPPVVLPASLPASTTPLAAPLSPLGAAPPSFASPPSVSSLDPDVLVDPFDLDLFLESLDLSDTFPPSSDPSSPPASLHPHLADAARLVEQRDAARRAHRRYVAARRRVLQRDPRASALHENVRNERREACALQGRMYRRHAEAARDAWRSDTQIVALRGSYVRARRKLARDRRKLDALLRAELGEPPSPVDAAWDAAT